MSEFSALASALHELADDAELLADDLDAADVRRRDLRDLLEREFHPDLPRACGWLWLESVMDEIVAIVVAPYAEQAYSLAFGLRALVADDRDEEDEAMRQLLCLDCGVNTAAIGEYYMVRDEVWAKAAGADEGMLCIGCLEGRLGRHLEPDDFTPARVNFGRCSARMRSRVFGIEEAV